MACRWKQNSYLHTGWSADVLQILAGAMNAEILILLQAWIPFLSLAFPLLFPLSSSSLSFSVFSFQDGRRVFGFA